MVNRTLHNTERHDCKMKKKGVVGRYGMNIAPQFNICTCLAVLVLLRHEKLTFAEQIRKMVTVEIQKNRVASKFLLAPVNQCCIQYETLLSR